MGKLLTVIKRLREGSTWAGIAALAVVFGVHPGTLDLVYQVIMGVGGLAAILLPDSTTAPPAAPAPAPVAAAPADDSPFVIGGTATKHHR